MAAVAVDRNLFPDGLKTTGQHPPLPEYIAPFEKYPKEITGPTVWKAEDFRDNPEKWTHWFTSEELEELSRTADEFIAKGIPLTGISKVSRIKSLFDARNPLTLIICDY